jgi:hypothetical protein
VIAPQPESHVSLGSRANTAKSFPPSGFRARNSPSAFSRGSAELTCTSTRRPCQPSSGIEHLVEAEVGHDWPVYARARFAFHVPRHPRRLAAPSPTRCCFRLQAPVRPRASSLAYCAEAVAQAFCGGEISNAVPSCPVVVERPLVRTVGLRPRRTGRLSPRSPALSGGDGGGRPRSARLRCGNRQ